MMMMENLLTLRLGYGRTKKIHNFHFICFNNHGICMMG